MIIDGKAEAASLKAYLATTISIAVGKGLPAPRLTIIQVGDNPASNVYVKHKSKDCAEIGITCTVLHLSEDVTTQGLIEQVKKEALDCDGLMVQLPLPTHIDEHAVLNAIPPEKDVDGLTDANLGWVMRHGYSTEHVMPCTAAGIIHLLNACGALVGSTVLILNRSNIVGKPLAAMLLSFNATPIIAHSKTYEDVLDDLAQAADIFVTATGQLHGSNWLAHDFVNPRRSILVDVSTNRNEEGKLCGDVDPGLYEKFEHCVPSPGGVGPMTRAYLLHNVVLCWSKLR